MYPLLVSANVYKIKIFTYIIGDFVFLTKIFYILNIYVLASIQCYYGI